MSLIGAILTPTGEDQSATLATVTATAELVLGGNGRVFSINATGDINIRVGNAGMGAPTAANYRIPANSVATFDLNVGADRIRIFNPTGGTITYYIQFLART